MKKKISMFMVFLMVLLTGASLKVEAASKISKKKATLEVDATLKLSVSGTKAKVKWSTSNEKNATINQKGVVTAKKAGAAVITATVDKKKYKCTIFVVNSKNMSIAIGETAKYTSGEYIVGEDIPAGTYTLKATSGFGFFKIYDTEKKYEKKSYDYKYVLFDSDNISESSYKNCKLKTKNYIIVPDGVAIEFSRTK